MVVVLVAVVAGEGEGRMVGVEMVVVVAMVKEVVAITAQLGPPLACSPPTTMCCG